MVSNHEVSLLFQYQPKYFDCLSRHLGCMEHAQYVNPPSVRNCSLENSLGLKELDDSMPSIYTGHTCAYARTQIRTRRMCARAHTHVHAHTLARQQLQQHLSLLFCLFALSFCLILGLSHKPSASHKASLGCGWAMTHPITHLSLEIK